MSSTDIPVFALLVGSDMALATPASISSISIQQQTGVSTFDSIPLTQVAVPRRGMPLTVTINAIIPQEVDPWMVNIAQSTLAALNSTGVSQSKRAAITNNIAVAANGGGLIDAMSIVEAFLAGMDSGLAFTLIIANPFGASKAATEFSRNVYISDVSFSVAGPGIGNHIEMDLTLTEARQAVITKKTVNAKLGGTLKIKSNGVTVSWSPLKGAKAKISGKVYKKSSSTTTTMKKLSGTYVLDNYSARAKHKWHVKGKGWVDASSIKGKG